MVDHHAEQPPGRRLALTLAAFVLLVGGVVPVQAATGPAILTNGPLQLGVRPLADLNAPGDVPSVGPCESATFTCTTTVGLRIFNLEALADNCECEGWGLSYWDGSGFVSGMAQSGVMPPTYGLTPTTWLLDDEANPTAATSIVDLGALQVTHKFTPGHSVEPTNAVVADLPDNYADVWYYRIDIEVKNNGATPVEDVRYRRVADFDIEPTTAREDLTIVDPIYVWTNGPPPVIYQWPEIELRCSSAYPFISADPREPFNPGGVLIGSGWARGTGTGTTAYSTIPGSPGCFNGVSNNGSPGGTDADFGHVLEVTARPVNEPGPRPDPFPPPDPNIGTPWKCANAFRGPLPWFPVEDFAPYSGTNPTCASVPLYRCPLGCIEPGESWNFTLYYAASLQQNTIAPFFGSVDSRHFSVATRGDYHEVAGTLTGLGAPAPPEGVSEFGMGYTFPRCVVDVLPPIVPNPDCCIASGATACGVPACPSPPGLGPCPPVAKFSYTVSSLCNDLYPPAVTFNDLSTASPPATIVYWQWNFGDGTPDYIVPPSSGTPTHNYADEGAYTVTLTVRDSDGLVSTYQLTILVKIKECTGGSGGGSGGGGHGAGQPKDEAGTNCDGDSERPQGDSISDCDDNCPTVWNENQFDQDKDGLGDLCDPDIDGDGILNGADDCVVAYNPSQRDLDHDGIGDACDDDIDGDGIKNLRDDCVYDPDPDQANLDGDGAGDACDPDRDGDGVLNDLDCYPDDPERVCPEGTDVDRSDGLRPGTAVNVNASRFLTAAGFGLLALVLLMVLLLAIIVARRRRGEE